MLAPSRLVEGALIAPVHGSDDHHGHTLLHHARGRIGSKPAMTSPRINPASCLAFRFAHSIERRGKD